MAENGLLMVAQGIRLIKPHRLAPAASAQTSTGGTNVISNALPSTTIPVPSAGQTSQPTLPHSATIAAHPLMKQILAKNAQNSLPLANGVNGVASPSSRSSSPATDMLPERREEDQHRSAARKHSHDACDKALGRYGKIEIGAAACNDELEHPAHYMCEWDGCGALFSIASAVLSHVSRRHLEDCEQLCQWPGCDGTLRSKWSLVTHVQDHHANEAALKLAFQRRSYLRDGLAPTQPHRYRQELPREVPHHPGYSKHAAIEAIRRHAFNFLPRDITDEPEGPVTKSIRLTSCLILRNLARYSATGRHLLRRHERHLCWLALSRLESSHALAQLLSELHNQDAVPASQANTQAFL